MTELETIVDYFYDDQLLLEMSNIQTKQSGLSHIVQVCSKGGAKPGARVKVSNIAGTFHPTDNFILTLEYDPRVIGTCKLKPEQLESVKDWIIFNREHLVKVWNDPGLMSGTDVDQGLKKLIFSKISVL